MKLLVLGGTRFVGRAVVTDALARGWDVTALHRGVTGSTPCPTLHADRTDPAALAAALQGTQWDAVIDTWSAAPKVVQLAARTISTQRFAYVSSLSVYVEGRPAGGNESWPTVDGTPGADKTDYAADKRGGELAALESHPSALLGRAGLILGPHEDIGRLPWWLDRCARGGRVVAPGRPEAPLQFVDARDLATWLCDGLADDRTGAVDLTSPTIAFGGLLSAVVEATGGTAELVWVPEAEVLAAGAEPWTQLPCWVPENEEFAGFMEGDTSQAIATGLRTRPVGDTVRDTWTWLQEAGMPVQRSDRPAHGLPENLERELLAGR